MQVHEKPKVMYSAGSSKVDKPVYHGKVLIVDDEPNVRQTFRLALESAGFDVDEARDGTAALDWLARSTCDVVLLDLLMPELGGMEVLRRLRDNGNDVPVVIVTAHGSIPDAVEAMRLGAIDFLAKPLTPDVLRAVVAEVIVRHAAARPEPKARTTEPVSSSPILVTPSVLDLTAAKLALNLRRFDEAADLLEKALDLDPYSAEAHTLMGVLLESGGQNHAAYQSYREALMIDPRYGPARENMRRYCERFGLDHGNARINPAAGH